LGGAGGSRPNDLLEENLYKAFKKCIPKLYKYKKQKNNMPKKPRTMQDLQEFLETFHENTIDPNTLKKEIAARFGISDYFHKMIITKMTEFGLLKRDVDTGLFRKCKSEEKI
jgi:hypothetical protein